MLGCKGEKGVLWRVGEEGLPGCLAEGFSEAAGAWIWWQWRSYGR